uniref:Uncharacterized protein n=1 Tax=Arundo donax TaxID=35708 RepID=A0A0A8ZSV1_ARUDO
MASLLAGAPMGSLHVHIVVLTYKRLIGYWISI